MADLVIWCVFVVSLMKVVGIVLVFYVVWLGFLFVFFGFLLGFLGDFIRNLQRYLCVVWLGFLLFFWVNIGFERYFFVLFFRYFLLFFHRDFDTDFYGFRDFGIVTMLIFLVLWDYL